VESHDNIHTVAKYLPVFALGVLTYRATWKPSLRVAMISAAGFLAMTTATAFTPFFLKTSAKPFDQDIWSFLWMLPLVPYVMRSLTVRSTRLDRHLGNLSYPLYLVHFAVITAVVDRFGPGLAVKIAGVGLAVTVALLIYWLFDRPVDRWRVRLTETDRDAQTVRSGSSA
jgi:peptidoglycan/LPS O-acetylase OafA/YrhL